MYIRTTKICPLCSGTKQFFDPTLKLNVACPQCVRIHHRMDSYKQYFSQTSSPRTNLMAAHYAGTGIEEDDYSDTSGPGGYSSPNAPSLNPRSNYPRVRTGDRTHCKVYQMLNGQKVLIRIEIWEAYYTKNKRGQVSSLVSWRLIETFSGDELQNATLPEDKFCLA